ncbi:MAG: flagellar filament capping protein FliD [Lachnospiraceae bacterium]|nr:flagellar filament capping protein FliD [Lachnospiraceae bacterium]
MSSQMRLSGLISGMDTESIITQLVSSRKTKVDKAVKGKTRLEWKQDAWKNLNTKIKSFQDKYINNMRFRSSYMKKTTSVSNSSAASVITGEEAMNGVQTLYIDKLAKTSFLTGGEIKGGGNADALSTAGDLGWGTGTLTFTQGEKSVNIDVTETTSISDVLTKLKDFGLNANFDAKNQRFFISAKESGKDYDFTVSSDNSELLKNMGLSEDESLPAVNRASKVKGEDASIRLNGATFTSNTNVFTINGLTITAMDVSESPITLSTKDDTEGIYGMIKDMIKSYSSLINEMDKLYNAPNASSYDPLTDEEKEAMSDTEVEKWETKIKDSLLRRDSEVDTVSSALKQLMSSGIEVGGKTMYLSDFGISTLSWYDSAENEKNALHIDGDPDDEATSGKADKLKGMIAADPESVVDFFSQLSKNVYQKMTDLSKSVDGYRSYGSFYNDKRLKADFTDYESKIKELETKLATYEDKWYAKFAKMETAMAKLQDSTSAVTALLGG